MTDNHADQADTTDSDTNPYPDQDFGPVRTIGEEQRAFLKKKGAVEILALLADGPKRFSEIDDSLVISHGTVSSRLTEGARLGLLSEEIHYPDEGGKIKLYELTSTGRTFAEIATDHDIDETTERRKKAKERHEAVLSEFQEEIEERISENDESE